MSRLLLVLLMFVATGTLTQVNAKPFVPDDDAVVVETLPIKPLDPRQKELKAMRLALAKSPDHLPLALAIAREYVSLGRTTGDPRYASYAQAALSPWWSLQNPPADVLLLRATLKQRVHNFDNALADLALVLQRNPSNSQARLTRATIYQVRGEFDRAQRECEALDMRAPPIMTVACSQTVASLTGNLETAYRQLKSAADSATVDSSTRAWLLVGLAEMASRSGNVQRAETHFKEALLADPEDVYLLGGYADLLLEQKRFADVLVLLESRKQSDPLLLRYALAAKGANAKDVTIVIEQLRARFDASRMRGDRVHLREEARFTAQLLNEPQAALVLAKENWLVQKEPADARIVLETAIAMRDKSTIESMRAWIADTRLQDVSLERLLRI